MSLLQEKQRLMIVTACMRADGTPTFVVTDVEATPEECANGVHYYLAEADLLEAGYEEPFVHFDPAEAPPFLLPTVRDHLGLAAPAVALHPAR